jgi:Ala-tRNA(Pro) deacylase
LDRIRAHLEEHGVHYRHVSHEPTPTSQDAARARGEPLEIGGKALLIRAAEDYHLFVLSAALRLDSTAVRRALGAKRTRFATADELLEITGLVPGSLPPFGEPILPLPLYVDRSILANERIAFNAGSLTDSIIMDVADYRRVAPIKAVVDISRPGAG